MSHHFSLGHILILAVIAYVLFVGRGWWPRGGSGPGDGSPA